MFDLSQIVDNAVTKFLANFFDQLISFFGTALADVMGTALNVLALPHVKNGILFAQALAFTILVLKSMSDTFNTYILYNNGDPDADPSGLLFGVAQAVAVIATLPWCVTQMFIFGSKVARGMAGLSTGQTGINDWSFMLAIISSTGGVVIVLFAIVLIICILVVALQATIRGAELALMAIIGPIMAINLSSQNRSVWSAWFKQLLITCTAQALQIFMLQGALSLLTSRAISSGGLLLVFGWLWVTIKTPKFLQQFAHSTGFTGAVGGGMKQAGSMYMMRKMLAR